MCSDPARRGDWGQRAPKDQSGIWEARQGESQLNDSMGIHNRGSAVSGVGQAHSSVDSQ